MSQNLNQNTNGIVLYAKTAGQTSFDSLFAIKRALGTKKVGHTGTLDNFAQGLLVVCVGNLTRLAEKITAFDKTYEAVLQFGKETDTLDPFGNVILETDLPSFSALKKSVEKFTGNLMQTPPNYSALHVNGKRASDLMREGKSFELQARKISVFNSEILEVMCENGTFFDKDSLKNCGENEKIHYAKIRFSVSKGTYIRTLASDIAKDCASSAFLIGLLRTKVGNFSLNDAACFKYLPEFSIKSCLNRNYAEKEKLNFSTDVLQEIRDKTLSMTPSFSVECGFFPIELNEKYKNDFFNGRPLKKEMFSLFSDNDDFYKHTENSMSEKLMCAVFLRSTKEDFVFCGVVSFLGEKSLMKYEYVIRP